MPDDQGVLRPDSGLHDVKPAGTKRPPGVWKGETYYGRSQLKAAPFNNWVVGGYIFLAGLSGGAQILSAIADLLPGGTPPGSGRRTTVRRGRYIAMLAPTLGSALLLWDLHTPARFYNMFRIFRATSPMSIGTYILTAFTAFAGITTTAQFVADQAEGRTGQGAGQIARLALRFARTTQVPASITGAGLATYTAALLSSTSTPLWAAAPKALSARFASASLAAAAAALSLGRRGRDAESLDRVMVAALAAELAAGLVQHRVFHERGVAAALDGAAGKAELAASTLGTMLPIGLAGAALLARRLPGLSDAAAVAVLVGSAALRISIMAAGNESARRPEISFRFTETPR